jgi:hypothetical protein
MAVMSSDRLEGAADVGPYEAQWQARRRPVPVRSAVPEPLPQHPRVAFVHAGAAAMPSTVAGMASHRPSAST